ncbi:hypothetical protein OIE61_39580 [Streptomyces sp. NBC_01762]|uniref:three-helix bundle dimerization domain-containing protein n=1 Tax=unclassified Streptomyces TaxID=2593676 RepID=UPI002DDC0A8B|nr:MULTISPECIES: hypothetical protein [unclassified Streptomyces]WSC49530.1 hypothetical protein OIE61_39580 [Streptomyces sp. NBC_01762]WSD29102.1 hypothetical protein OHA26_39895 [Streptomyces sp. NBC_01751]
MSRESTEEADIRRVTERLRLAYQNRRTPEQVDAAVCAAVEHFKDSRIRDFVPVLAERRARSMLDSANQVEAETGGVHACQPSRSYLSQSG